MAVTSGYFNSVNGDRKYNADQMSEYFEGIINEGVCQHIGGGLAVTAGTGLSVVVATGKAFIGQKWLKNDAALTLTISAASESYSRIDAVVIRKNNAVRSCQIAVKVGTPAASPVAPTMTRDSTTYEMALAYVTVAAGASSVTVTDKRADSAVCGWAAVAQATSGEVDQMLNDMKTGFDGVVYSSPAAMVQGEDEKLQTEIDANGMELKNVSGLIGRKSVSVSNQMYQEIHVFDGITLNKDEYYIATINFDAAMEVSGYARLYNSSNTKIAESASFINQTKVTVIYKPTSNTTNNWLGISFNGSGSYTAHIDMYSVWGGSVSESARSFGAITFTDYDLRNGTANNPGNANYVACPAIKTKSNSLYILTNRPNTTGYVYRYQINPLNKNIDDLASDNTARIIEYITEANPFIFSQASSVAIQVAISEYDTTNGIYHPLRANDFAGYYISIFDASDMNNNQDITTLKKMLSTVKIDQSLLRNGSTTNPYNTNAVATPVIRTRSKRIMMKTDRPNKTNCEYRYAFITVLTDMDDVGQGGSTSDYSDFVSDVPYNVYDMVNDGRIGVQVALYEYNTSTSEFSPLRIGDFEGYNIYVYDISAESNLIEGLPAYYDDYMKARIKTVWERDLDIVNTGDSFVFFSDCHEDNKYYSPNIAKYVVDNSSVDKIICGGDMINQPTSKAEAVEKLMTNSNKCRVMDDIVFLRGNHDTNPYGTGQLSPEEYYAIFNKHIEKYIDTNGKNYFYRDNESQKIRYIFMDTGADGQIDSTQISWIQSTASELDSSWTIVLMGHWVVYFEDYTTPEPTTSIAAVVTALSGINAKIACIIGGHTHIDMVDSTSYSFPIICVTCDSNGASQIPGTPSVNRNGGTINEQSLSVFHINTSSKKIYMTRIGGGLVNVLSTKDYTDNDAEWSYT